MDIILVMDYELMAWTHGTSSTYNFLLSLHFDNLVQFQWGSIVQAKMILLWSTHYAKCLFARLNFHKTFRSEFQTYEVLKIAFMCIIISNADEWEPWEAWRRQEKNFCPKIWTFRHEIVCKICLLFNIFESLASVTALSLLALIISIVGSSWLIFRHSCKHFAFVNWLYCIAQETFLLDWFSNNCFEVVDCLKVVN